MPIEKTKAWDNWNEVIDLMEGLWPTRARKEMSADLLQLWKERLGNYEKLTVIGALKDHASNSTFFPKLNQIVNSCKSRTSSSSENGNELQKNYDKYEKERDESIKEMRLIINNMSEEELDAHKEAELEERPSLLWMKDESSTSFTWKMIITQRIKAGDKPKKKVSELPDI